MTCLEESFKGDEESQQVFLITFRNVAEAQGGIGALAKKAHVGRESLYKMLSGAGNSKWHTLVSLCVAMGLNLRLS
ncbi:MAG TPA: transcriptional regulator [Parachlamydiaceae bacterium]|nr:transcriptional regulator [Parachlamydiaceae bacterium]